jgi:RNA-directed DNA polymerase
MTPEPKDKLDTMTTRAVGTAPSDPNVVGVGAVNGPEDETTDWALIDWRRVEDDVRRLRQRIFTASQAGDLAKVRNLQKLMLRSRANTRASVRRVTELNAGRKTAGIDGKTALLPQSKAELADWMQHRAAPWKPKPVKRVYIPEEQWKSAWPRNSCDRRQMSSGSGAECTGTRVGSPVRPQILRVPAGARLS